MMTVREMMEFLSRCDGDDYVLPRSGFDEETFETELAVQVVARDGSGVIDGVYWTEED